MSITTIANRYAHALADVIIERREVAEVSRELEGFARLMQDNRELYDVFASPVIATERKRAVLSEVLARLNLKQTSGNFLQLLLQNNRLHNLPEVLKSLMKVLDERSGVVSAEVITARPISNQNRSLLTERLRETTGREVRLSFRTDPEIIGGVVTRLGSLVFDGSIRTQLAQLKQQLSRG
jgi:F-type H+-transporting ATPase subunit delta